jgi:hypothetical protein
MVRIAPPAERTRETPTTTPAADDIELLGDRIAEIAAHLHAATYQLLTLLREFDEREGWGGGGFLSCAHWLSWRTGIGGGAAREKVRVARALAALPHVSAAMRRGQLSFAKVRAITRVATPENEAQLLELARTGTAAQLERIVRAWRRADRLEERAQERERHAQRHLTIFIDDDGSYVVRGRLDPEAGALLLRAVEAAEAGLGSGGRNATRPTDAEDVERPSAPQRRADAIGFVAEAALRNIDDRPVVSRADRFQVVLHVDAEALRTPGAPADATYGEPADAAHEPADAAPGESAAAATAARAITADSSVLDGVRVSAETSRRLACDASRVVMTHDARGATLDVGRRTRTVPPAIRRALEHRDRVCRFPGCDSRFCDAHHVVHWIDGGRTRLDNLVLLCRRHHRAVHEDGYSLDRRDTGEVTFRRPDGRALPGVPPLPAPRGDAVTRLRQSRCAEGIAINEWTCASSWAGEALDIDIALLALRPGMG